MVKCQVVMDALERIAPHHLAEDWDNPGLLVGSPERQVSRILVALDVSDIVVRQAVHEGAEMIVAHHPLLFKPIKKIRTDEPLGHRLQVLLQHDIAVAAAHTNLDIARGGVNDVLAEAIGLSKLSSFVITQQGEGGETERLGCRSRWRSATSPSRSARPCRRSMCASSRPATARCARSRSAAVPVRNSWIGPR